MIREELEHLESLIIYTRNRLNNYGSYLHYYKTSGSPAKGCPLKIKYLQIKEFYKNKFINYNIIFKENYKIYEKELKIWFKQLFNKI